jgi:DNA-binding response OmpR family regulator
MERLSAAAETAAIPVVVVSADAHEEQVAAAQECGAREYLVKPLDLKRLGLVLDALLPSERP